MSVDSSKKIIWTSEACIAWNGCGFTCLQSDHPEAQPVCRGCTVPGTPPIDPLEPGEQIPVIVDGTTITCRKGALLIDVIRAAGSWVPSLCHHPRLPPAGTCRLCLVELEEGGQSKTAASCAYPVTTAVAVRTDTPGLQRYRKHVIAMLLRESPNAPRLLELADICNVDPRLAAEEDKIAPAEKRGGDGCVLCGRCVRVATYFTGCRALEMCGRGSDLRPAHAFDAEDDPACIKCGACTAVCPTGARGTHAAPKSTADPRLEPACDLCVRICPEAAVYQDDLTGVVGIFDSKCRECGLCIHYCPTNALRYTTSYDR